MFVFRAKAFGGMEALSHVGFLIGSCHIGNIGGGQDLLVMVYQ